MTSSASQAFSSRGRLTGRIAVITGASRGIGAAVARRFAAEGAHVVLLARTVGGLEAVDDAIRAAGGEATLVPQDLQDLASLDHLGPTLFERLGRVDILVGNAGHLGQLGPVAHTDPREWQKIFTINVLANQRLLLSLDPLLRASDAGRAVFVTAGAARGPFAYWGAYAASKAALEMMVLTYAAEVSKTALKVNLLDPGVVRTVMRAAAFPGEDASRLPAPETISDAFVDLAAPDCPHHGQIIRAQA